MMKPFIFVLAVLCVAVPLTTHASNALLNEVTIAPSNLTKAQTQPFTLVHKSRTWTVAVPVVKTWFKSRTLEDGTKVLQLRPGAIYDYLNRSISPHVNDLGGKSRFSLSATGSVELLSPGRKGSIVDGIKTSIAIRQALVAGKKTATVAMKEYRPALFSAADFKKMKFPHQLGHGESNFAGSPRNRIHNITVATKRYNGLVLLPGETFSFNQYLGTVDGDNGYVPELVIKENVTTPEFGGGICQVSTTAFRGALASGLAITQRRNHSYPVRYYGTPGYDATVYPGSSDLSFVNDTAQPILIKTSISGTRLSFDMWGTSDGRSVKVNGPFVTSRKPDGSLTAAVAQIVSKGGKTVREQNFVSKYQSPDKFPIIRKANGG